MCSVASQQTVAMALAVATHHSARRGEGRDPNEAPQETEDRQCRGFAQSSTETDAKSSQEAGALPVVRGRVRRVRPAPLEEPRSQERVQRHAVEQMIESFVPVPMLDLDALVPQMVDVLKIFDGFVRAGDRSVQGCSSGRGPAPRRSSRAASGGAVGGSA